MKPRTSPMTRIAALVAASALALTACGQGDDVTEPDATAPAVSDETTDPADGQTDGDNDTGATDSDIEGEIRFSWWGSDARHALNEEMIDAFEAEYPGISVVPDFTDWNGYWDRLATQTAGGDAPDVIMMDVNYVREYADRGVLANLNDYDIDTADIDPALLGSGDFDGGLWGLPTGGNIIAMMADPQIFDEAGVEMPDDTTWTWEDYADLMQQISENTPEGVYGAQNLGIHDAHLMVWLRQHGQELWAADGGTGFDTATVAEYWQMSLDMMDSGAIPPASLAVEVDAGGPEQSLVATNNGAISTFWTNQLAAVAGAAGRDLQLLRFPGEAQFDRTGLYVKASMLLTMSADTEHPEAAALFLNWMQNSTEAGEIILSDRGLPSNLQVREHILPQLSEVEQQAAEFIEEVSQDVVDAPPAPPRGAGQVVDLMFRINEEVIFGQITPEEGAERLLEEAQSLIG